MVRRRGVARAGGPRVAKCVYHGPSGCRIGGEARPAACNYYICSEALGDGGSAGRALHDDVARRLNALNASLARRIADDWPAGFAFDAAFVDWLGAEFAALEAAYST